MSTITITFPDGSSKPFEQGTTGMQIAESISRGLAKNALSFSVNGEVWDLQRPITIDAAIKIFTWNDAEGKDTYWHSSAHLMAEAIEALFPGTKFGIGPSIENGFYYDIDMGDHSLTQADLQAIETKMVELSKRDVPYERSEVKWEDAVAYFTKKNDPYKLELLDDFKGQQISMYHHGNFTDLCYGPHLPSTGKIKFIRYFINCVIFHFAQMEDPSHFIRQPVNPDLYGFKSIVVIKQIDSAIVYLLKISQFAILISNHLPTIMVNDQVSDTNGQISL